MDDRVTAGIWIEPASDRFERVGERLGRKHPSSLSRREISRLATGNELNRQSLGMLNDQFARDPSLGIRLYLNLIESPETWGQLFDLDETTLDRIREGGSPSSDEQELWKGLAFFEHQASSVTFDVVTPQSARTKKGKTAKKDRPAWMPDKIEIEGKTDTDGKTSVGIKIVWEF
ncbi:hypothetical protein [Qipengyuania vesicularis]|uniref:hypothetical protein n=1 Tax=Qipengyuania vesicularis TaxID=2867232 RepID=UPI001C87621F|nr:hypothetical protein [Qipengyuania vesicularis]MBX7526217.1 hypothetical protein [Qipengyuania vesicularis]